MDYDWIRLLYSGDGDYQEIAYHRNQSQWHEKDLMVFRSLLAPGQTAIDVGANLGFVSTILASIVGREGRVLSFEPSPTVYPKLLKTIEANDLTQITPFNCGCGEVASTEVLHTVSKSSGNSSIVAPGEGTEIKVVRLDDVDEAQETPVRLLKIDTEGYEPMVLRGAQRFIEKHRPTIYMEMGGDYVDSTLESIQLLEDAGYDTAAVRDIDWSQVANGSDYFFYSPRRA